MRMKTNSSSNISSPKFKIKDSFIEGERVGGIDVLASLIDWEEFAPLLESFTGYSLSDWAQGAPLGYDPILLVKIIVLESLHEWTHEEVAASIRDRLSLIEFLGLKMGDRIPRVSDIAKFHQIVEKSQKRGVEKLVQIVHDELAVRGLVLVAENAVSIAAFYAPSGVDPNRVTVLKPESLSTLHSARSIERNALLKETDFKKVYSTEVAPESLVSGEDVATMIQEAMSAESRWNREGRAFQSNFVALTAVAIIVLTILGGLGYFVMHSNKEATHGVIAQREASFAQSDKEAYQHISLSPVELVRQFVSAETHQERLSYVRYPQENNERVREFFQRPENKSDSIKAVSLSGVVNIKGSKVVEVLVEFESGETRIASVVQTAAGKFIDFASYERYNATPWKELLSEGGRSEESRVTLSRVSYYNGEFNEDAYVSYALRSPDIGDKTVYGYTERGGNADALVQALLLRAKNPRVVLNLVSLGESHRLAQFHIERVVSVGWVLGEVELQKSIEILQQNKELERKLEHPAPQ